ncbi:MAG: extracellular solute-binding protein [Provencibacterium sp.]|jgi:putative aldouronate transport system substrate-binding protein|nr:extracellular solute-binding protein [Provencibacterium sp.]
MVDKKKLSAALLALMMLAGCSSAPQSSSSAAGDSNQAASSAASSSSAPDSSSQAENSNLTETGTYPIVKDKITLTYWVPLNEKYTSVIKDFNELEMSKELEKITNIHIEYQHPVEETAKEQFNLMIASGNLPDIIEQNWTGRPGGPEKALAENVIIDMTDLIDQYAPNYKKILSETPEGARQSMTNDGRHYMMTGFYYGEAVAAKIMIGPQYRRDWLQRLGLSDPTTIEEWHEVLTAIKNQDANGNGDPNDEIPFISKGASISCSNDNINVFASGFGANMKFYHVDGEVKFGPYEPEWKEYLMTMNQWYNEGLIDPEFATTDKTMFDAKIFGDQAGTWFCGLMGDMGRFVKYCDEDEPDWEIAALPYPIDTATGKAYNYCGGLTDIVCTNGANITTSNKYPIETTRWFDYAYTEEGHRLYNNGVEGLTYNLVDGEVQFTDLILNNPDGLDITRAIAKYCRAAGTTGAHMPDLAVMNARASHPIQREARDKIWSLASTERTLPSLTVDAEYSQRQADILNEVYTYVDEMVLKFIMGLESFDNYDNYLDTLRSMGLEEAIEIQQKTFDAFNGRG